MRHFIMISLFVLSSLAGCKGQETDAIKIIDVQTFKDSVVGKDVQLIDVRTPEEYEAGHIDDAKNIDFFAENFQDEFSKLDKEKPVYIYCKSGNRSGQSALKLKAMGFNEIYDLQGGILNYQKE